MRNMTENETTSNNTLDPFAPENLRLSQDFNLTISVKKKLMTVPARKPNRQDFVRVHPDNAFHLETVVLELKEERETYLVDKALWPELPGDVIPKSLFTAINRQGVVFIWPIRLPQEDGRQDEWNRSALEAALIAKEKWIRLAANMSLGAYEVFEATGTLPEPKWPEISFRELLEIAFKANYIDSLDHPVLKRLRGEL